MAARSGGTTEGCWDGTRSVLAASMDASWGQKTAKCKERPVVLFMPLDYYDRSCYCQVMKTNNISEVSEPRRSKGQASRAAILLAATKLATTKGLDGLS